MLNLCVRHQTRTCLKIRHHSQLLRQRPAGGPLSAKYWQLTIYCPSAARWLPAVVNWHRTLSAVIQGFYIGGPPAVHCRQNHEHVFKITTRSRHHSQLLRQRPAGGPLSAKYWQLTIYCPSAARWLPAVVNWHRTLSAVIQGSYIGGPPAVHCRQNHEHVFKITNRGRHHSQLLRQRPAGGPLSAKYWQLTIYCPSAARWLPAVVNWHRTLSAVIQGFYIGGRRRSIVGKITSMF